MIDVFLRPLAFAIAVTIAPRGIDIPRALLIGAVAYASGTCVYALHRFAKKAWEHRYDDSLRLWVARAMLRICSLGLFYFVLDTLLASWGDPLYVRTLIGIFVIAVFPWAMLEVTRDVLREPGSIRRHTDS